MEDRLLMALEYIREYRTYFHASALYKISQSACYRNIRWIEDVLIKNPDFALPGRKALLYSFNLKAAIWAMRKLSGFNDQK